MSGIGNAHPAGLGIPPQQVATTRYGEYRGQNAEPKARAHTGQTEPTVCVRGRVTLIVLGSRTAGGVMSHELEVDMSSPRSGSIRLQSEDARLQSYVLDGWADRRHVLTYQMPRRLEPERTPNLSAGSCSEHKKVFPVEPNKAMGRVRRRPVPTLVRSPARYRSRGLGRHARGRKRSIQPAAEFPSSEPAAGSHPSPRRTPQPKLRTRRKTKQTETAVRGREQLSFLHGSHALVSVPRAASCRKKRAPRPPEAVAYACDLRMRDVNSVCSTVEGRIKPGRD